MFPTTSRPRRYPLALLALCLLALAGCAAEEEKPTIFDEIGHVPAKEASVELQLGSFIVPIPVVLESATERFVADNLMQVEIDLFAVVDPAEAEMVETLMDRNEGRLRDTVIRVCRSTTRDDLLDSQKATLKAHLLDAVQPLMGGEAVRRLGVRRVILDEL
ncbi:MAG: flagellar basal body-associated FliL family protein [Planctomycetota bacterium]